MTDQEKRLQQAYHKVDLLVAQASTLIDREKYDDSGLTTDGSPVSIIRLFESDLGAGYYCIQPANTTVTEHVHHNSTEHFIVLDGELKFSGDIIVSTGGQYYFRPGESHAAYASCNTTYICIVVPPEEAYLFQTEKKDA